MKNSKTLPRRLIAGAVVALVAIVGFGLWTHLREAHGLGHSHDHGSPAASALTLNDGKRWTADQHLRTGMQRIRDAAALVVPASTERVPSQPDAKQFAATVQESVDYLVKNCKLEPKADATLHVIITDLMSGAGLLAENPSSSEGVGLVSRALQRYPEYFEHPGWVPLPAGDPRG